MEGFHFEEIEDSDNTRAQAAVSRPFSEWMKNFGNEEEVTLRETLKRCSPATVEAASLFRKTGDLRYVDTIVRGIIERYVEIDVRPKLKLSPREVRLVEDLGVDSLTMIEIVMLAEEVMPISIGHEELRGLSTLFDVQEFVKAKISGEIGG